MNSLVTRVAQNALDEIIEGLIDEGAIDIALEVEDAFRRALRQLEEHPRSGARYDGDDRRLVLLSTYLLFYFVDDEKERVVITNIRHGARRPLK